MALLSGDAIELQTAVKAVNTACVTIPSPRNLRTSCDKRQKITPGSACADQRSSNRVAGMDSLDFCHNRNVCIDCLDFLSYFLFLLRGRKVPLLGLSYL